MAGRPRGGDNPLSRPHQHLILALIATFTLGLAARTAAQSLPERLSDQEFWAMVGDFSEDGGSFVSENIISNEIEFQRAIPELQKSSVRGVYLGVGPEQNFTYITALKPSLAFILDIRRANLLLHLTYKALIELSADRGEFLSRLFARAPLVGIGRDSTARDLFDAIEVAPVSPELAQSTLREILNCLEHTHGFSLTDDDRRGITEVYRSLYAGGPTVRGDFGGGSWIPSYLQLMTQTDVHGRNHSFVESEENFGILKKYESNNLIVPLVGDFAGPKALREVARYVKDHNATVTTFYTSNVEEYLFKAGSSGTFFANVSALPINPRSMFIRAFFTHTNAGLRTLLDPIGKCLSAVRRGDIRTYADLISRSKAPKP
jgi:hypothetical protein